MAVYTIDPAHSQVEFGVKHMMLSTVKGRFGKVGARSSSMRQTRPAPQ